MRAVLWGAALAILACGSVAASPAPNAGQAAKDAVAQTGKSARMLYVCEDSSMTRRAFAREFGEARFETADSVQAKTEAWSAPRCISQSQMRRLKQVASAR